MSWIRKGDPSKDPALAGAIARATAGYPPEYRPGAESESRVPDPVRRDSIVLAHSLIPRALEHLFAGYGALLDPGLPLSRRQHEMIATVVSARNRCLY